MKMFIAGISAIALMTGVAHADSGSGHGSSGPTIQSAWKSLAGPLDKLEPVAPTPGGRLDPKDRFNIDPVAPNVRKKKPAGLGQTAYIDQIGDDNSTNANQTGAGVGAVVDSVTLGDDNVVRARQRLGGNGVAGDYSTTTIQGHRNNANTDQVNRGSVANEADIHMGGRTDADARRAGSSGPQARDNLANVNQRGQANISEIDITEPGKGFGPSRNEARIDQTGRSNEAKIDIVVDDNEASIGQIGRFNEASSQLNGRFNDSRINQDGRRNAAMSVQVGDRNGLYMVQEGNRNDAYTRQDGDDNMSVTLQIGGNANSAWNLQNGDGNMNDIFQDGDLNVAHVRQDGNLNVSRLEQFGEANSYVALQDGFDFSNVQQHGSNNVVVVSQTLTK